MANAEKISFSTLSTLEQIGYNIDCAIKRRHLRRRDVAEKALISEPTLRKLLRGEPGVSLAVMCSVLDVLGLGSEFANIAQADKVGRALAERDLPKRVRVNKNQYDF